jgi:hypothetical protein
MAASNIVGLPNYAGGQAPADLMYVGRSPFNPTDDRATTLDDLFSIITRNITNKSLQWADGDGTATVSAANSGKIKYSAAAQEFQFSHNGGAYFGLSSLPFAVDITSNAAQAFAVGPNGVTNPTFQVVANAVGAATGVSITGRAAGSGVSLAVISSGANEDLSIEPKGTGGATITSAGAAALAVGPNGNTNPALRIVGNVASAATGISITGRAAGAGVSLAVISSGANESISIEPKGTGNALLASGLLQFGGTSSAFSALRGSGNQLETRLADNSAYTFHAALHFVAIAEFRLFNAQTVGNQLRMGNAGAFDAGLGRLSAGVVRVTDAGTGAGSFVVGTSAVTLTGGPKILVSSTSAAALEVGPNGETNPTLRIVGNVASAATGISITGRAAAAGVSLAVISSGANEDLSIEPKGSGLIYFGNGLTNASPVTATLRGTGAIGTDQVGPNFFISAGSGTGAGEPGQLGQKFPLRLATGTTLQSLSTNSYPFVTNVFIQQTDVTVSNTAAETTLLTTGLGTATIEAGMARPGMMYEVEFVGSVGFTGAAQLLLRAKLGGTTLVSPTLVFAAGDGGEYRCRIRYCIISVGTTGTANIDMFWFEYFNTSGSVKSVKVLTASGTSTFNFNTALAFDITADWNTADAANLIQNYSLRIDQFRA